MKYMESHLPRNKNAFTLVELIVVIVILAILATISFLSFEGYSGSARDSTRLSDLANISKGLEIFRLNSGNYPYPNGLIHTGTLKGVDIIYKGIFDDKNAGLIKMSKAPSDPLDNNNKYPYGITHDQKYYQIAVSLEAGVLVFGTNEIYIDKAKADGNGMASVRGNYHGILKFSTGSKTYIANVPSLLFNYSGSVIDMIDNKSNVYFVVNKGANLPYKTTEGIEINNKSSDIIIQELSKNAQTSFTGVEVTYVNESNIAAIFTPSLLKNFNLQENSDEIMLDTISKLILGKSIPSNPGSLPACIFGSSIFGSCSL